MEPQLVLNKSLRSRRDRRLAAVLGQLPIPRKYRTFALPRSMSSNQAYS